MPVTSLHITNIGPFDEVTLDFDPQVNVFTGPNNSGKSTLLWVLGDILVYPFTLPDKLLRQTLPRWRLTVSSATGDDSIEGSWPSDARALLPLFEKIGPTFYIPAQRHVTSFRSSGPTVDQDIETRLNEEIEILLRDASLLLSRVGIEAIRKELRSVMDEEDSELASRVMKNVRGG